MPSVNWTAAFSSAFSVFAHWAAVAAVYYITKSAVNFYCKGQDNPPKVFRKAYIYSWCVGACLFFSAMMGRELGTHREGGDDYMDQGEVVVDFEPTERQRWTEGAKFFFVMLPVSLLGACEAISKDALLSREEREKIRSKMLIDRLRGDDNW